MHGFLLLLALILGGAVRLLRFGLGTTWNQRWFWALSRFLFPPLLLLMTAMAIVCMGMQDPIGQPWQGRLSYAIALGFLTVAALLGLQLLLAAYQSRHQIQTCPMIQLHEQTSHLLPDPFPFVAQVGVWQPQLVVTQGLLDTLSPDHLQAVLVHEQAHIIYRDSYLFFALGWLRRLTAWLPATEALWQELLTLRELRADRWAAQQVDPLLLAESLLRLASSPLACSELVCTPFSQPVAPGQLAERIDALFGESEPIAPLQPWFWLWLLPALLPLGTIPLHQLSHEHFCLLM